MRLPKRKTPTKHPLSRVQREVLKQSGPRQAYARARSLAQGPAQSRALLLAWARRKGKNLTAERLEGIAREGDLWWEEQSGRWIEKAQPVLESLRLHGYSYRTLKVYRALCLAAGGRRAPFFLSLDELSMRSEVRKGSLWPVVEELVHAGVIKVKQGTQMNRKTGELGEATLFAIMDNPEVRPLPSGPLTRFRQVTKSQPPRVSLVLVNRVKTLLEDGKVWTAKDLRQRLGIRDGQLEDVLEVLGSWVVVEEQKHKAGAKSMRVWKTP